jgi:two-component system, OmpR family, KDP operon response regulator KdpE
VTSAKILVVDDEPQIRRMLRTTLTGSGYQVEDARSGEESLEKFRAYLPDLVIMDWNMPGMGGLNACREIRTGSDVPIIILTVRNAEKDKVEALDAGADDYVSKPFGMQELLARIRAALRRSPTAPDGQPRSLVSNDLEIDFEARRVRVRSRTVRLTPKEFQLLRYLVSHEGKAVSHRQILQAVWGPDYGAESDYLRVFINHLRKKIEVNPAEPKHILTEPWVGYRFALPEA